MKERIVELVSEGQAMKKSRWDRRQPLTQKLWIDSAKEIREGTSKYDRNLWFCQRLDFEFPMEFLFNLMLKIAINLLFPAGIFL